VNIIYYRSLHIALTIISMFKIYFHVHQSFTCKTILYYVCIHYTATVHCRHVVYNDICDSAAEIDYFIISLKISKCVPIGNVNFELINLLQDVRKLFVGCNSINDKNGFLILQECNNFPTPRRTHRYGCQIV